MGGWGSDIAPRRGDVSLGFAELVIVIIAGIDQQSKGCKLANQGDEYE
jgi:hypothetical protein